MKNLVSQFVANLWLVCLLGGGGESVLGDESAILRCPGSLIGWSTGNPRVEGSQFNNTQLPHLTGVHMTTCFLHVSKAGPTCDGVPFIHMHELWMGKLILKLTVCSSDFPGQFVLVGLDIQQKVKPEYVRVCSRMCVNELVFSLLQCRVH